MKVIILATKNCNHRPMLEKHLQSIGVTYSVLFIDDNPELIDKYGVHQSPNLIVDDAVVFRPNTGRALPTPSELSNYLGIQ